MFSLTQFRRTLALVPVLLLGFATLVQAQTETITTFAGNGTGGYAGDGLKATLAELQDPTGVAVDSSGNVFVADFVNNRIRRIDHATQIVSTIAGNGTAGYTGNGCPSNGGTEPGDGGPATEACLSNPSAVAVDSAGNIFIADFSNGRIRKVDGSGTITTVAGGGLNCPGDGLPATSACLVHPSDVVVDRSGNLFIADTTNNRIREVFISNQIIATVAGNGVPGFSGDGGPARSAQVDQPTGIALDGSGNLYIADYYNDRIREVTASSGNINTIAGNGTFGYTSTSNPNCPNNGGPEPGDGGPATSACLNGPSRVSVAQGRIFIGDTLNERVRVVQNGIIQTFAGGAGSFLFCGDGGPALQACLYNPQGLAAVSGTNVYIADASNNRIRYVYGLFTLSVSLNNNSAGTVTSVPPGISCPPSCSGDYPNGSIVTLTGKTNGGGWIFGGWSGQCTGEGPCSIPMNTTGSVQANFSPLLSITVTGTGIGSASSSPTGIGCPGICAASFSLGSSVTLSESPASGSTFAGWSGACSGTGGCTVTMNSLKAVTATFNSNCASCSNGLAIQQISFFNNIPIYKDVTGSAVRIQNPMYITGQPAKPVAYAGGSTMQVALTLKQPSAALNNVTITGTIGGFAGKLIKTGVNIPAGTGTFTVSGIAANAAFPHQTKLFNPMTITWTYTTSSGSVVAIGQTANPLYVTFTTPAYGLTSACQTNSTAADDSCVFLSVLALAVGNGNATTPTQAFVNTWALFAKKDSQGNYVSPANVTTWGTSTSSPLPLYYYRNTPPLVVGFAGCSNYPVFTLLTSANRSGQCGAFAHLMMLALQVNGISSTFVTINSADGTEFLVKNFAFGVPSYPSNTPFQWQVVFDPNGDPMVCSSQNPCYTRTQYGDLTSSGTIAGQNSGNLAPSEKVFLRHFIVKVAAPYCTATTNNCYYDPSYGVTYLDQNDFEQKAVSGYMVPTNVSNIGLAEKTGCPSACVKNIQFSE